LGICRAIVRLLVGAQGGGPEGHYLLEREDLRTLEGVLLEVQLDLSGRPRPAYLRKADQVEDTANVHGGSRVEIVGVESQHQMLGVLAGEVAGWDRPDDLDDVHGVGIRHTESDVRQGGAGPAVVGRAGDLQIDARVEPAGLEEVGELTVLREFEVLRLGHHGQR
jgi:hypothetical protein